MLYTHLKLTFSINPDFKLSPQKQQYPSHFSSFKNAPQFPVCIMQIPQIPFLMFTSVQQTAAAQ